MDDQPSDDLSPDPQRTDDPPVAGRRGLLKALAVGVPGAAWAVKARSAPAEAPAATGQAQGDMPHAAAPPLNRALQFFNAQEALAMDAIAARLIPADELGPGAKEAGVTRFLDGQLAGAWGAGSQFYRQGPFEKGTPEQGYQLSFTPAEMIRRGLAALDAATRKQDGRPFAELDEARQDAWLHDLQAGKPDFSPLPSDVFFQALLDATIEGFFSDPLYGGNADMVGWKLVGFPGAFASFSNDIERHGVIWAGKPVSIANAVGHTMKPETRMAKTLPAVDVAIIGGGWTGSIIGKELAAAKQRVVVLERGQARWPSPDFQGPNVHDELKYTRRHELHQDAATETFTFRNSTDQKALPMRRWQFAYPGTHLGGAGNHWSGAYYRFDPTDFRIRSHYTERYGAGIFDKELTCQDWPLTYDELEPYFDRYDYLIGASGQAGNLKGQKQEGGNPFEPWRSRPYPNPPMKVPYAPALFGEAARKLGYHPYVQPSALCTRPYVNSEGLHMSACVYCGFCSNFGCEHFAKASPQVCILPVAMKMENFEIRTGAQVLRVELTPDKKRARGVTYVDAAGEEIFQPAEIVVLCAFGINNVRLLLLSGIGKPYDPVTNTGVVGRNYTHQTTSGVNLFFDESVNINPFMGAGAVAVTMDDFSADNFDHGPLGFVGGGYLQIQVVSGAPIGYHPTPKGTPSWGGDWKKAVKRYYNHSASITITGSAQPWRGGYLSLDPTYKDAWGLPLLRVTYDFPDNDIRMSAFLTSKGDEIGRAMKGISRTEPGPRKRPFSATVYQSTHLTGGAAMGDNPETSVVNRFGQSWDVPNVFVTGAALFPQNSGYNPTGTVGATAYWIVEKIKADYLRSPGRLVSS